MENSDLVDAVERFYPGWTHIFELSWQNLLDDAVISGIPNRVERAGIMHKNLRSEFRPFCDVLHPVVRLIEQSDGLDYMLIDIGEKRNIMIRIGRYGPDGVRRNPSQQQRSIQGQQLMDFADMNEETITATIGYTIEDDFTEAGRPAWWMGRLVLLREHQHETEYVHDIAVFKKPKLRLEDQILTQRTRTLRLRERRDIERIAEEIRKAG